MSEFKFTKRGIESLPFTIKGFRSHADPETRGLAVRVGTTAKVFYLVRKVAGRTEFIKIGPFPDVTVEQARKRAAELNADIAKGVNPAKLRREDKAEMTLATFWPEYMERYSRIRKKPRTVLEDERTFQNYLAPLASKKLSKIGKTDCQRLHHDIAVRTSGATANRALAVLSAALGVAADWGYLTGDNPARAVKRFKEKARDRFIQADEMPRFWQAMLDEPNRDFADLFMLALLTGARRSNLLAMRWDEISVARAEWRIPDPKNGEPLTIPLIPEAARLLESRQEMYGGEWVFPGRGDTPHLTEPKAAWKRICERAGLENLRLHDLRRTLGSSMAAAGVNTITTARTMGHKTLTMALRYQQLGTDPRRAAIEAGAGAILANAGARETAEVVSIKRKAG